MTPFFFIRQYFSLLHILTPFSFFADIRAQLNEQLRWLDARVEAQVALAAELQEFFRRRAEVELDYSRGLDKLAKGLQLRHKEQRNKSVSNLTILFLVLLGSVKML